MKQSAFLYNRFAVLGLILLMSVWVVMGVESCQKKETGAPVITGFRSLNQSHVDSSLTVIKPGQILVIQGRNFETVQQIFFDGVPASFNINFTTNENIIVTVPDIIFDSVAQDDMNVVKVVTNHGIASYTIPIVPPPPVINSVSNEFAQPGDTITLTGSYLYTVQEIDFPNGARVNSGFSGTVNGSWLQVVVPNSLSPSDVGPTDSIAVVTMGGVGKYAFYNTTGMIANFEYGDPHFGWQWWGGIISNDATAFPGNWGNYIEIKPSNPIPAGDGSWWTDNRAVMIAASNWSNVNIADPPANYALKFQVFVKNPWSTGSIHIVINGDFSRWATWAPWQQTDSKTFQTNGWITVSIPLSRFVDGNGNSASTVSTLTGGQPGATVQLMLYNDGNTPLSGFDAAFDNVRVVKIQ
ncbi:MAG: hypothetical protein K6T34_00135 [Thermoflavifilum sp.]|nr:hypothetical protein [Thermoflavifilum sp.]